MVIISLKRQYRHDLQGMEWDTPLNPLRWHLLRSDWRLRLVYLATRPHLAITPRQTLANSSLQPSLQPSPQPSPMTTSPSAPAIYSTSSSKHSGQLDHAWTVSLSAPAISSTSSSKHSAQLDHAWTVSLSAPAISSTSSYKHSAQLDHAWTVSLSACLSSTSSSHQLSPISVSQPLKPIPQAFTSFWPSSALKDLTPTPALDPSPQSSHMSSQPSDLTRFPSIGSGWEPCWKLF